MTDVLCFKPGVANDQTAFEPMADIYKYLERHYDYDFTIVTGSTDTFTDDQLKTVSIPNSGVRGKLWKGVQFIDHFPVSQLLPSKMDRHFKNADAVITVDPTSRAAGIIGIKKAVSTNTPVWFDAGRTTIPPYSRFRWMKRRKIFNKVVHEATGIIVTSPKVLEYFRDISLFDEEIAQKFTVMGHPTDTTEFAPEELTEIRSNDDIEILTISRLVPEKGLYYLLEAVNPILSENDKISLTVIGKGPMEALLKREIRDRDLSGSVELKGTVPHNQVPGLLQRADIFVNHSVDVAGWEEFFGAANIEAMACGLPCVVSDSGSIPYVTREPDGVRLVSQRDVVGLRKSIQELVQNPSKRVEMGRSAREFVEREYSIETIGERYHRMLQRGNIHS